MLLFRCVSRCGGAKRHTSLSFDITKGCGVFFERSSSLPPPVEVPTCLASSDLEGREDNGSHGWEMLGREEATKVSGNELFKWGKKHLSCW